MKKQNGIEVMAKEKNIEGILQIYNKHATLFSCESNEFLFKARIYFSAECCSFIVYAYSMENTYCVSANEMGFRA